LEREIKGWKREKKSCMYEGGKGLKRERKSWKRERKRWKIKRKS